MHPFLNVAVKAARRAGQIINRAALEIDNLQVARKGQSDYVTQIDRADVGIDAIKDAIRETGADQCVGQAVATADADAAVIEERAAAFAGGKEFVAVRVVDDAVRELAILR